MPYDTTTLAQVYVDIGRFDLPDTAIGSAWVIGNLTADGLPRGWQRTWADDARTVESGLASFSTIARYLQVCDDTGEAVRIGLTVNGHYAICICYPSDSYDEIRTQLIWYDEDASIIFTLSDFPGKDGFTHGGKACDQRRECYRTVANTTTRYGDDRESMMFG